MDRKDKEKLIAYNWNGGIHYCHHCGQAIEWSDEEWKDSPKNYKGEYDNMNELHKLKFQIVVDKQPKGLWSFGICLSHCDEETYIYVNLFKVSISIGRLYVIGEE